jgi:pimeloyl-ACP methyl ester carboxylesterase
MTGMTSAGAAVAGYGSDHGERADGKSSGRGTATESPTFLLVHGSWHGPWCWDKLIPQLRHIGFAAATVALPSCGSDPATLGSIADDAAAIEAAVAAIDGDVVLVGHSYGGVAVTEALLDARVRHLVYVGAFMPDTAQMLTDLTPPGGLAPYITVHDGGFTTVDPALAIDAFFADCDPATARWAAERLGLHKAVNNITPVTRASWRDKTSTYVVLTEDHAWPASWQRKLAKQATYQREMPTSHSPFLSRPVELAALLRDAAALATD